MHCFATGRDLAVAYRAMRREGDIIRRRENDVPSRFRLVAMRSNVPMARLETAHPRTPARSSELPRLEIDFPQILAK